MLRPYEKLSEMGSYRRQITGKWILRTLGTVMIVQQKQLSDRSEKDAEEYVFFNHQSAKDFIMHNEDSLLYQCGLIGKGGPDLYLARTCLFYLTAQELRDMSQSQPDFANWVQNARDLQEFLKPSKSLEEKELMSPREPMERLKSLMALGIMDEYKDSPVSIAFPFFKYASAWYRHIKTNQQAEGEWARIARVLDPEQPFLEVWIRGLWESGVFIGIEDLFRDGDHLGIQITDLAVELDIVWLTEMVLAKQLLGEVFNDKQIVRMASVAPKSFHSLLLRRNIIPILPNIFPEITKSEHGQRWVQLLLEHRAAKFRVTEQVLEAAAANESECDGTDLLRLLLDHGKPPKITNECLRVTARRSRGKLMELLITRRGGTIGNLDELLNIAANDHNGFGVMQALLKYSGSQAVITKDLLVAAAQHDLRMLELLLDNKSNDPTATECLLETVATNGKVLTAVKDLLDRRGLKYKITQDLMVSICSGENSAELIRILLQERTREICFTERTLSAVFDGSNATEALKPILEQQSVPVEITDRVLSSALEWSAKNRFKEESSNIMSLLAGATHGKTNIRDTTIEFAAREVSQESEMKSILRMRDATGKITDTLVTAAADNSKCGRAILQVLSCHARGELKITEETLKAAARNESQGKVILEWVFQEFGNQLYITETVLLAAAENRRQGKEILEWMHQRFPDQVHITEHAFLAATKNQGQGKALLQWMFQKFAGQAHITESVLFTAASNAGQGKEIFEWILQEHADHVRITETLLTEVVYHPNPGKGILHLLLGQGLLDGKITETVVKMAALSWLSFEEISDFFADQGTYIEDLPTGEKSVFSLNINPESYGQVRECHNMARICVEIINILTNQIDPEHNATEQILLPTVGNKAALLMMKLAGQWPISWTERVFQTKVPILKKHGITARLLLHAVSDQPSWFPIAYKFHRISGEPLQILPETRLEAATSGQGHLTLPLLMKYWKGGKDIAIPVLQIAAKSGQIEVLEFLFKRYSFKKSVKETEMQTARFCRAAKEGDEHTISQLLKDRADPDIPDSDRHSPLWHACVNGNLRVVHCLLETGAFDVNRTDRWGRAVLHWAASLNYDRACKLLMQYGADPDRRDFMGLTPCDLAGRFRATVVRKLFTNVLRGQPLDYDAKLEAQNYDSDYEDDQRNVNQWTALHLAARGGYEQMAKAQIYNGAEVDCRNQAQRTPLYLAVQEGHTELVHLLLEHGADSNAQDKTNATALHFAAERGHLEVVKILLEHGCNIEAKDNEECTPLHYTARSGHTKVVGILLRSGADVRKQNNNQWTALDLAARSRRPGPVKSLLNHIVRSDASDDDEFQSLYLAARIGHEEAIKTLLEVSEVTEDGGTPLHAAVAKNLEAAKFSCRLGADLTARKNDGGTVLHTAVHGGHLDATKWLLSLRLDVDAVDYSGQTPLHTAILKNKLEIVTELLKGGASVNLPDVLCYTPLHHAVSIERVPIIELLLLEHADAHIPDGYGKTSFDIVQQNPELYESVRHLLREPPKSLARLRTSRIGGFVWALTSRLLENGGQPTWPGYNELGHCLKFLNHDEEAVIAFQQRISPLTDDSEAIHDLVTCNNCWKDSISGTRFVCRTCSDVDLCSSCLAKYNQNSLENSPLDIACKGHDFMAVPGLQKSERDYMLVNASETKVEWSSRIRGSFGVEMKGKEGASLRTRFAKGKIEIQSQMRKMWESARRR